MVAQWENSQPERVVLGQHETVQLPLNCFVRLPQIREGANPELPALVESIRARDIINQIDVARLTPDELTTYMNFVESTWGSVPTMDELACRQQPDGMFYLVVAGHSRFAAINILQEQDPGRAYEVVAKVRDIHTPEEIIALQMDENIHTRPSIERRAIAVVELYRYGLEQGKWNTKADFIRAQKGKISAHVLDEAIGFAQLPPEARDFVFARKLPYSAAVALGKATDTMQQYVANKMGVQEEVDLEAGGSPFYEAYRWEIGIIIAHICNRNLNGPAAIKYIQGQVALMQKHLEDANHGGYQATVMEFALMSPEDQTKLYLAQLRRQYNAALADMARHSVDSVQAALRLHAALIGETSSTLIQERDQRMQVLGGLMMDGADVTNR